MTKVEEYLIKIDEVIEKGRFKNNWESLSAYREPQWYKDAKFGIFTHWGVYTVPAFRSEWYSRNMYTEGHDIYKHHLETYGKHSEFGYHDFIPMFKAEKFDAKAWLDLFKESGAKFYMPVAEHHDGFQMYESELSDCNAFKMGPKRDIIKELKQASDDVGMIFCASNHRAENYWFMSGVRKYDPRMDGVEFKEPYGFATELFTEEDQHDATRSIFWKGANKEHLENWLARACEIVDKFQPRIVWFDWWIQNYSFKEYLKKFAAYYYNRAEEWGVEVAINYKNGAYALGTAIFDIERGQMAGIRPRFWQTDTSVARNSWCYTPNNVYKTAESLVCDLIDIVSKNGALLLNVGPKEDGTIPEDDARILREIGAWLKVNGEAIYNTTFWSIYGEGPTQAVEGEHKETKFKTEYTSKDVRFTYKCPYVYAHLMKFPESKQICIDSLRDMSESFGGAVENIKVLGYDTKVNFKQTMKTLEINFEEKIDTTFPVVLKIEIN